MIKPPIHALERFHFLKIINEVLKIKAIAYTMYAWPNDMKLCKPVDVRPDVTLLCCRWSKHECYF